MSEVSRAGMPSSAQPGDIVLDQFRLDRPIASGAMGDVWVAKAINGRQKVAVKLARGEGLLRALREAEALTMLDHPSIVKHVSHGPHGEEGFALVMELLDGVPLSKRVQAKPLDVPTSLLFASQISEALAHSHERGVVHRDVKASNIIIVKGAREDRAVLIDFGLGLVEGSPRLSSADVVLGSSHTMPPEQVRGVTAGPTADVYSLAILVFRMVCGQYPFHASSPVQVLAMHAHAKVPAFHERATQAFTAPRGLEGVVLEGLAKDPAQRPTSVSFAERLQVLVAVPEGRWVEIPAALGRLDPDGAAPVRPSRARSRLPLWLAAGLGVVLLCGLLAFWLW